MSHQQFAQKLNVITAVLVLILFGTICSSYAIDCMDLWDEESIAEMIEDEKRYEEIRKARQVEDGPHWDDEHEYDNDGDDHDDDDDDEEHDDEDASADHEDEIEEDDEEEEEDEEQDQGEAHETSTSHTETRHKRQLTLTAGQQRPASTPVEEDPSSDLEVAETHLFRPVFRYKSQYTERRRVRDNFTPPRQ